MQVLWLGKDASREYMLSAGGRIQVFGREGLAG